METQNVLTVSAQSNRAALRCIGNRQGLENSPRDTTKHFGNLQRNDVLSGKENRREGNYERQAGHNSIAVAKPLTDISIYEQADDFAYIRTVGQAGLPWRGDLPSAIWKLLAVLLIELRHGVEVRK